jgi:PPOX class probable F420-dependent enzyme
MMSADDRACGKLEARARQRGAMSELKESDRALLAGRHYAILATRNEDGSCHLTPVWYLFLEGSLFVGTFSGSRKARNVKARGSAALIVDVRKTGEARWVSASGPAEIVSGEDANKLNEQILARYLTETARKDPRVGPVFAATDDVTIRIRPAKWTSWKLQDLDQRFFGGLLGSTPEKWFLPMD